MRQARLCRRAPGYHRGPWRGGTGERSARVKKFFQQKLRQVASHDDLLAVNYLTSIRLHPSGKDCTLKKSAPSFKGADYFR